jgi:hypothetical protein
MADKKHKTVFLLVEGKGTGADKKTYFNRAGTAFVCGDGSLNVKLDLFPSLTFNIRDSVQGTQPASNQRQEDRRGG